MAFQFPQGVLALDAEGRINFSLLVQGNVTTSSTSNLYGKIFVDTAWKNVTFLGHEFVLENGAVDCNTKVRTTTVSERLSLMQRC